MIDQEKVLPSAERDWMGPPIDIRQSALAVIATTRHEWALRAAGDDPVGDFGRFAHPLFRLALDAMSSSAGRARVGRVRSRRRVSRQFAT
ncbi:MAG TPA: hypothetical protein VIJ43_04000 [Burkholderiales bacterium]